jgi:hypothetical protein
MEDRQMVRIKNQGLVAKCVRFSVAAMVAALIGAGRVVPAAAQTPCTLLSGPNTFYGIDAGSGAIATDDSAFGFAALTSGDSGGSNTAVGNEALCSNTTGVANTATGAVALSHNTTGTANTATGWDALFSNTTGIENTATGHSALNVNTSGAENTATGWFALLDNTTGVENTATGAGALEGNTTGNGNIAVGAASGINLTTGNDNIDIGAHGVAGESNVIRIGGLGIQTEAFVQGIYDSALTKLSPRPVVVNSNGRLGYMPSAARYKRDIRDMGDASSGLMKLRTVSFRYKDDPAGTVEYGLIAEEVQRVYPELVTRGPDGKVESVRYELLPALLINEVQKLAKENQRKDAQIGAQQKEIEALKKKDAQIGMLIERMNAMERQVGRAKPEHLASAMR